MDDDITSTETPSPVNRWFVVRWAACAVLVVLVFVVARLAPSPFGGEDAATTESSEPSSATEPSGPSVVDAMPPSDDAGADEGERGFDEPQSPVSGDSVDNLDALVEEAMRAFDELAAEALDDSPAGKRAGGRAGSEPSQRRNWTVTSGRGAAGGRWSIDHPSSWQVRDNGSGVMIGPDRYPGRLFVTTGMVEAPLKTQAEAELESLTAMLGNDAVVRELEKGTVEGREAVKAEIRYTDSRSEPMSATILWIARGESLYVYGGEAPAADREAQQLVQEAIGSFSTSEGG